MTTPPQPIGVRFSDLRVTYTAADGAVRALREINLSIAAGSFTIVVGPNGAGKSTLLRALTGECEPDSGLVELVCNGSTRDCRHMPRWERARQMSQIHQDPKRGTVASMTVLENLRLATIMSALPSTFRFDSAGRGKNWFQERLNAIGLAEKLQTRVAELSQGQRQLLALELAMLRRPAILLADEHTASLDQENARKCLETTVELCRQQQTTVLMVTHNLSDALTFGDRLVVLKSGCVTADLKADEKQNLTLAELIALCGYNV